MKKKVGRVLRLDSNSPLEVFSLLYKSTFEPTLYDMQLMLERDVFLIVAEMASQSLAIKIHQS